MLLLLYSFDHNVIGVYSCLAPRHVAVVLLLHKITYLYSTYTQYIHHLGQLYIVCNEYQVNPTHLYTFLTHLEPHSSQSNHGFRESRNQHANKKAKIRGPSKRRTSHTKTSRA